jgi:release factor glutamine methyltransferase
VTIAADTMDDATRLARALGLSRRDALAEAELLLARALGIGRARLVAHPELAAESRRHPRYLEYLERRVAGEPVAYILGEREFYGLTFRVTPDVLIPRPETELLVELALSRIPEGEPLRLLDIGTGSGCIAVTLAQLRPRARVIATDASAAALEVARSNARRHGLENVEFRLGDAFAPVVGERFAVIVSNPPYVARGDPHLIQGDLRFEPKQALTSGAEGLDLTRVLVAGAHSHLEAGAWLLLEHGHDQGDAVKALMRAAALGSLFTERDLAGLARVSGARSTGTG